MHPIDPIPTDPSYANQTVQVRYKTHTHGSCMHMMHVAFQLQLQACNTARCEAEGNNYLSVVAHICMPVCLLAIPEETADANRKVLYWLLLYTLN
jgi:hypothetical protein